MQAKRNIFCGNVSTASIDFKPEHDLQLHLFGKEDDGKLTLQIEDIRRKMFKDIPALFLDLLDIATYVYSADQAITRGTYDVDTFGDNWRRDLHFIIPVRTPDFWKDSEMMQCLTETLGFLSDDCYDFTFTKMIDDYPAQQYLKFNEDNELLGCPEQVMMFSGGLDSLAGIIDESLIQKRKTVLVTHKSTPKLDKKHRYLQQLLSEKLEPNTPVQIGIRVHKNKKLNKEYTQRSRSFLYMTLGATIARMCNHSNLRFYENGVISLNLPVCAQVVGSRATRTTHPRSLDGFQKIISLMIQDKFIIENPFIWKTKADVVSLIAKNQCADLIAHSTSCTHTWEMTTEHTHCGSCSQCIDRRFAILSADLEDYDSLKGYKVDVFTESNLEAEDKTMLATYLERANSIKDIRDEAQFISKFSEVCRVFRYLGANPGSAAQRVFDLYKRHSNEVNKAMDKLLVKHSTAIRERTIPGDCLTRVIYESGSVVSIPAYAQTPSLPLNFFRKRGDAYEFRFQGRRSMILTTVNKGASYISYLLSRPHESTPIVDLVCGCAVDLCDDVLVEENEIRQEDSGFKITNGLPLSDAGVVADRTAIEQYKQRALELLHDVELARQLGDEVRVAELEEEMIKISNAIEEARGLGGRLRKSKDGKKNVRDAFAIAIKRALDVIKKYDKELFTHLDKRITRGNHPVYHPEFEIEWETRPISNERRESDLIEI